MHTDLSSQFCIGTNYQSRDFDGPSILFLLDYEDVFVEMSNSGNAGLVKKHTINDKRFE